MMLLVQVFSGQTTEPIWFLKLWFKVHVTEEVTFFARSLCLVHAMWC
jgi:hypothetical protein